ncbi:MAG: hypothetical protein ACLGSD_05330 [Acidobacteriota bacterium]
MHIRRFCTLLLALAPAVSCHLAAQTAKNPPPPQPWQSESISTSVQTLANGATITQKMRIVRAVDSRGRELAVSTTIPSAPNEEVQTTGSILDPEKGSDTFWRSQGHQAWVREYPPVAEQHGCWQGPGYARDYDARPAAHLPASSRRRSQREVERLGTRTFMGLKADGQRWTTTVPAGQIGNNAPLVRTVENWIAQSPHIPVYSIENDPQRGKTTLKLVGFKWGEPDPALFKPPADYKLIVQHMQKVPCADLEPRKP